VRDYFLLPGRCLSSVFVSRRKGLVVAKEIEENTQKGVTPRILAYVAEVEIWRARDAAANPNPNPNQNLKTNSGWYSS